MKALESDSTRSSFAEWMDTQGVHLQDLEQARHAPLVKELISREHWWWHEDIGFLKEPIPPAMMTLERATLMLTGWHIDGFESSVIAATESAVGQTFAAGRNISAALSILRKKAAAVHDSGKAVRGFIHSEVHSRSFVDLQTARQVLRKANEVEQFLSEPIEKLLHECAFVIGLLPTYAELEAENEILKKKLNEATGSHKAALFTRGKRMLEALQAFEKFLRENRGLSKKEFLDWYDDNIFNHPERPPNLMVPTREELERWFKANPEGKAR